MDFVSASCDLLTGQKHFLCTAKHSEIRGEKFGISTGFPFSTFWSSLASVIPPVLHSHLDPHVHLTETKETNLRNVLKKFFFFKIQRALCSKVKQARAGPKVSRKMRLQDFKTVVT
jgi:hypothetical protein